MGKEHLVIIGNGPAGNQAALTLKEKAPDAAVTLISKERETCYRPHLLPRRIAGEMEEEALYVCPVESYKAKGVKLRTGQKVVGLNLFRREAILDHKEVVRYTGLIIAVGGKPRIPEPLLVFRDHMFTLKTLDDARLWKMRLSRVDDILIMGGDLTSFAVTKALLGLGKRVFFILDKDAFWPLRGSEALFRDARKSLAARGVEVLPGGRLRSIARLSDDAYEVQVDGDKIRVGMIGAFSAWCRMSGFWQDRAFASTGASSWMSISTQGSRGSTRQGIVLRYSIPIFGITGFPSATTTPSASAGPQRSICWAEKPRQPWPRKAFMKCRGLK
jgi:NAD(P)H-nitrite reductase large subunit